MRTYLIVYFLTFCTCLAQDDSFAEDINYYPLQVGNVWQYLDLYDDWSGKTHEYFMVEITKDTILSNGYKYYVIEERNFSAGTITNINYERIDSSTTRVYRNINGTDIVIDSLSVKPDSLFNGSRLYAYNYPDVQTLCIGEREEIILNNTFIVKEFDTMGLVGHYYKLAKGLGYSSHWGAEISTWSRTLIYAKIGNKILGDKITSVKEETLENEIKLYQNYPNPFNISTIIEFYLPKASNVKIVISNCLGEEITTLLNEYKNVGLSKVSWNGKTYKGNIASSGIYIYSIETDNYSSGKTMLLLK